jgi:hypothetical protein
MFVLGHYECLSVFSACVCYTSGSIPARSSKYTYASKAVPAAPANENCTHYPCGLGICCLRTRTIEIAVSILPDKKPIACRDCSRDRGSAIVRSRYPPRSTRTAVETAMWVSSSLCYHDTTDCGSIQTHHSPPRSILHLLQPAHKSPFKMSAPARAQLTRQGSSDTIQNPQMRRHLHRQFADVGTVSRREVLLT